jgi:hypothetical protein
MRFLLSLLLCSFLSLTACAPSEGTSEVSKAEAAAADGKADNGTDYCAEFGWYDDDECDTFCPLPDPDCAEPESECLFGESLADLSSVEALTLGAETRVSEIGLAELGEIRAFQIVAGMTFHEGQRIDTVEAALEVTDDADIWIQQLTTAGGDALLLYTFWQGDNPMGFFFADGEAMAAYVGDGDLYDCEPTTDDGACRFGETSYELLEENDAITKGAQQTVDQAAFDGLSAVRRQQIISGFARHEGQAVAAAEIIDSTDDHELYLTELTAPGGMRYVLTRFYQGDNVFGFLFADGEILLGDIQDDYIEACALQ